MAPARPVVVTNTSPVIGLCKIERLQLLEELCSRLIVPTDVWLELNARDQTPEPAQLAGLGNVVFRTIVMPIPADLEPLGKGEREAILLALHHDADLVLLDDLAARKAAKRCGLACRGTLGVLVQARREGLIPAVRPLVQELIDARFRLPVTLANRLLAGLGEPPL